MEADRRRPLHPDRLRWNEKHARAKASDPLSQPVDWLTAHEPLLRALPRGRALDVAAGRGRNALYLSELGFAVDAVDVSDEALRQLREAAEQRRVPVECHWRDLTSEPLPDGPYPLVVDLYYLDRMLWPQLETRLAPGGLLIVEVLAQNAGDERPFRVEPGELARGFPGLEILETREVDLPTKTGSRQVSSLVARKPQR